MEREEVIKKFQEKGFNEETIDLLLGAIEDFEETKLEQYVPIEEVVNRICKNLSQNMEYVDFEGNTCGRFENEKGKILISERLKDDLEKLKSVFFHEFIHCITYFKELDMVGFHTTLKDPLEEGDDTYIGYGLNEGITSYIERRRNEQKNYKGINSYPILNSLVENLMMIVGKEKLLNIYFNEPDELEDLLMARGISDDMCIINGFDEIRHCENRVIEIKRISNSKAGRMFMALFGEENQEAKDIYKEMGQYVDLINEELFGVLDSAKNVEQFEVLTKFIARLDGQKFGIDKNKIYGRLLKEYKNLISKGFPEEELEKVIDNCEVRDQVDMQKDFESLLEKDNDKFLINLNDALEGNGQQKYDTILDILNEPSYNNFIMEKLFKSRNSAIQARDILPIGKILKENPEMFLDDISISLYDEFSNKCYLITDSQGNKFFYSSNINVCEISENNIGKGYDRWEDEDVEVKIDEDFSSVTVTENEEEMVYSLQERIKSNFETELEYLNKSMKRNEDRLANLEKLSAPSIIISKEKELIEKNKREIEARKKEFYERKNKRKIESSEMEAFEGQLEDVEKADKKKEVMQANIRLIKEQENSGQDIGEDE